jgi:uncharacterized protein YjgD (DUF1641 family)
MSKYTTEISEFAVNMSTQIDEDLAKQYDTIREALNNANYTDRTKEAIERLYSSVIQVFEDATVKRYADVIRNKLGDASSKFINTIATALYGLGDAAVSEAFRVVSEAVENGKSEAEAAKELYIAVANKRGIIYREEQNT